MHMSADEQVNFPKPSRQKPHLDDVLIYYGTIVTLASTCLGRRHLQRLVFVGFRYPTMIAWSRIRVRTLGFAYDPSNLAYML
jgi:hypothetical protein